ncbi:MAG TPA: plasmid mobilization relaxosome protein MobC [Steroidobacteraceae bacterium]|jgi:predicted DNA-binding protein|nr:plasmid mobilization relaxosome protein MobC [Steroidobacteraceae bacterium]
MTAGAFIQCRVPSEMKSFVRALAERRGITESRLIKQLLAVVLRAAALADVPAAAAPHKVSRETRLYVRLAAEDWRLLKERSSARGLPSATYISLLVRAHLRDVAPLPKTEYLALKQSVVELTAIGRNLNQIARVANHDGRPALPGRAEVGAMLKVAEGLRDHFRALLSANERSWRRGHAGTSH